jgi:hypothetical protein
VWNNVTGSPAISNTPTRSGSGSYVLNITSASAVEHIQKTITTSTVVVTSFYVRFGILPTASTHLFRNVLGTSTSAPRLRINGSTNKLEVEFGSGGTPAVSANAMTTGTWYRIDLKIDVSANPNTIAWKIDGTDQTGHSFAQAADTITAARLGNDNNTTTNTETYFEDFICTDVSGDYPLGEYKIFGLRPNADGTHNNAANIMELSDGSDINGTTVTAYDKLDETDWTSTADRVQQTGNGSGNYAEVQFENLPASPGTVKAVWGYVHYNSAGTAANTGSTIAIVNGSEVSIFGTSSTPVDMSETASQYRMAKMTDPGGGWSTSIVDALKMRFGYSTDAAPDPYWQALMFEVVCQAASNVTVTPAVATSQATVTNATIALGSLTKTPAVATSQATVTNPTIALGSQTKTPTPATVQATVTNPTVAQGSQTKTPATANTQATITDATTAAGNQTLTPSAATTQATITDPTIDTSGDKVVTPNPANVQATVTDATTAQGSQTITPSASSTQASLTNASTVQGSQSVTPSTANVQAGITDASTVQGSQSATPATASVQATVTNPTTAQGNVTITPAIAAVQASVTDASTVAGNQTITPAASTVQATVTDPTIEVGAGNVTVTPAPAIMQATVTDATTAQGNQAVSPVFALAQATITEPIIAQGSQIVSPDFAPVQATVTDALITLGSQVVTPVWVTVQATVTDPEISIAGDSTITPLPSSVQATITNPEIIAVLAAPIDRTAAVERNAVVSIEGGRGVAVADEGNNRTIQADRPTSVAVNGRRQV